MAEAVTQITIAAQLLKAQIQACSATMYGHKLLRWRDLNKEYSDSKLHLRIQHQAAKQACMESMYWHELLSWTKSPKGTQTQDRKPTWALSSKPPSKL